MKKFCLFFIMLQFLVSCVQTTDTNNSKNNVDKEEKEAVKRAFEKKKNAILNWDLVTAYDCLSSEAKSVISFEQFKKACEEDKEWYIRFYNGASIDFIAPENPRASAVVTTGDGKRITVEYVKEQNEWREVSYITP